MSHRFEVINSSPGTYWINDKVGSPLWPHGMGLTFDERDPQNPGIAKAIADRVCAVLNLLAPDPVMLAENEQREDFVHRDCLLVKFQSGPIKEHGVNGVQVEDLIDVALERMHTLNKKQACRENSLAITKLEEARHWLDHRTAARRAQGVEGTSKPHEAEMPAVPFKRFA
jgi:hypothetical protein